MSARMNVSSEQPAYLRMLRGGGGDRRAYERHRTRTRWDFYDQLVVQLEGTTTYTLHLCLCKKDDVQ